MPGAVPLIRVTVTPRPPGTDACAITASTVTALAVGDEVLAGVLVGEPGDALVLEARGTPAAAVVVAIAERFGDLRRGTDVRTVWGEHADSAAVRARALSLSAGDPEELASGALRGEVDIDVLERIVAQALVAIAATLATATAGALTAERTP